MSDGSPVVSGVLGSLDVSDSSAARSGTHTLSGGGHGGGTCLTHRKSYLMVHYTPTRLSLSVSPICLSTTAIGVGCLIVGVVMLVLALN